MKISCRQPPRGFAIIVALVAITVLSILAAGLAISMKVESQLAQNSNDSEKLLWIARGGVERASWILSQEPPGPTSLKQIWAGGPGIGPETNGPLAGISLDNFPVGDGSVSLNIVEEESKINVNTADTALLQQVLTTMGVDAGAISTVSDSIQDWIDRDDATRPAGAESDYYQGLTPPYYAKNAPIDDIQELQLIKGVTPRMYDGSGQSGDQAAPFQHHKLGFGGTPGQEADYPFFFTNVFTAFSSGKININTADTNVLLCIPNMDDTTVQNIENLRDSEGGMNNSGVISSWNQLQPVLSNPALMNQLQRYCTFSGTTYEVHALARAGNSEREYVAVLFRGPRGVQVVGFHPK